MKSKTRSIPWTASEFLIASALAPPAATQAVVPTGPGLKPAAPVMYPLTAEQAEILSHMSIVYLDDGTGSKVNKAIRISGVSVQIVNGTGSHNLVVGTRQNHTSFGGLVAGSFNTISGPHASVSGGLYNEAIGDRSSISGGLANEASGRYGSILGGHENTADGDLSSVSGGFGRSVTGNYDWAAGSLFEDY